MPDITAINGNLLLNTNPTNPATPLSISRTDAGTAIPLAQISLLGEGTDSLQGTILLQTMNSGTQDGPLQERMRVHTNGNVGIGTTNPQYGRLMIEDSAVPLSVRETGQPVTAGGLWRMPLNGGIWRFEVNTAANGDFSTSLTPLTMTADSRVGIGTSAPDANYRLDVAGNIKIPSGGTVYSPGRFHIHGEELLYLLNKGGVIVGKAWGGNGNLSVEGDLSVGGKITVPAGNQLYSPGRFHIHGEELLYLLNKGGVIVSRAWGGNGNLSVEGNLIATQGAHLTGVAVGMNPPVGSDVAAYTYPYESIGTTMSIWNLRLISRTIQFHTNHSQGATAHIDTSGIYRQGSSIEAKDRICPLVVDDAIHTLDALNPVEFVYKSDASQQKQLGFIAEETPTIFTSPDRKAIGFSGIVALLTAVVKEQQKTINELKADIEKLRMHAT
jgi:hypothetical protein